MQITMVKKRLKDGNPCRKCSQAEQLLKDRNLWQHVGEVIWAVEDDPASVGARLAEQHKADHAPFFLVQQADDKVLCLQNTLQLVRLLMPTAAAELERAIPPADSDLPDEEDAAGWVQLALGRFGERCPIAFSGAEDVVLIDMAAQAGVKFSVFCLDTGRLHPETYDLIERVRAYYNIEIDVINPDAIAVQDLVRQKGLFSFYRDGHTECCGVRKVGPLRRHLARQSAWMTGQRRDQSPDTRAAVALMHTDPAFKGAEEQPLTKFNPLANWSSARVWQYIRDNDVPSNALHRQGFISIGCQPCTRATLPGQHEREGRWWWEEATQKECGLHSSAQVARTASSTAHQ